MAIIRIPYIIGLSALLLLSTAYLGITWHDIHEQDFINDLDNRDEKAALAALRRGANPNAREPLPDSPTFNQWLGEHLTLHSNQYQKKGDTALCIAIAKGNSTRVIRALLDAGANPNADVSGGVTPMMTAAEKGDTAAMQLLLDHHANINQEDEQNMSALLSAVARNNVRATRLLLERHADPHTKGIDIWLGKILPRFNPSARRRAFRKLPEALRILQEARAKP